MNLSSSQDPFKYLFIVPGYFKRQPFYKSKLSYFSSTLSCFVPIFPMFVFYLEMEACLSVTLYIGVFWLVSVPASWTRNKVLLQLSVSSAIMKDWNVKSSPTNGERERELLAKTQTNLNEHTSWCESKMFQWSNIQLIFY